MQCFRYRKLRKTNWKLSNLFLERFEMFCSAAALSRVVIGEDSVRSCRPNLAMSYWSNCHGATQRHSDNFCSEIQYFKNKSNSLGHQAKIQSY